MSYDESDYRYDEYMAELYEEHKGHAIEEFQSERLQSYYARNPELARPSLWYLMEGRSLVETSPTAALVFGAVAAEYFVKRVLLHPIVYGLVHDEPTAALIAGSVVSQMGLDRFRDLLFAILSQTAGIDLRDYRREGTRKSLWEELTEVQKRRNGLLHRAEVATEKDAAHVLSVCSELQERVFPRVIRSLGMHVHPDGNVCADRRCMDREELKGWYEQASP